MKKIFRYLFVSCDKEGLFPGLLLTPPLLFGWILILIFIISGLMG